jgi:hypothetical protein
VSGGVATLDNTRRVLLTFAADETGHTFVLTGTTRGGSVITETIAGTTAGTVQSVLDYKTLTSVTISANSTGNISIGTSGVGGSGWLAFDGWLSDGVVAFQCTAVGTVNYTVQQTLDDPNLSLTQNDPQGNLITPASVTWVNCSDTNLVAATTTQQSNYNFAPTYMRVVMNSGTGTVTLTALQHGGS